MHTHLDYTRTHEVPHNTTAARVRWNGVVKGFLAMNDTALNALDAATRRGASYADVRFEHSTERGLSTKNGQVAHVATSESMGLGVRVIVDGAWGFAATDDLTSEGIESAAAQAVEIARASATTRLADLRLADESAHEATWVSPCEIDPFEVSIEQQIQLLLAVDTGLRRAPGSTLAEASMD
ncbi:MAG: hypothetical protein GY953_37370, partial [bacterium]|nr:hypothetical protein [bacterium]